MFGQNYTSWFLLGEEMGGTTTLLLSSQYPAIFNKVRRAYIFTVTVPFIRNYVL
jgi:hypothetical protein